MDKLIKKALKAYVNKVPRVGDVFKENRDGSFYYTNNHELNNVGAYDIPKNGEVVVASSHELRKEKGVYTLKVKLQHEMSGEAIGNDDGLVNKIRDVKIEYILNSN